MRPPLIFPAHDDGGFDCQAMRRFSSNSITSLTIEYGSPIFIDMPKVEPSARRCDPALASRTVPEPSMSGWRAGSASRSKIDSGGAGITRSTETTSVLAPMGAGAYRDRWQNARPHPAHGVRREERTMALATDDILAIQKLIADYNHAVDAGDGPTFAALFVESGSLDSGFNVIKGHDELRDFAGMVPSMAPGARHWVSNVSIDGDGDEATAR